MLLKELIEQYADYEVKDVFMDFLERPKPKSIWDLKDGDTYFYLYDNGVVCSERWDDDYIDDGRRNAGNVFLTREESEFEIKSREVYTQVKRFAHEFSREEWEDDEIYKFYPYFNYITNNIQFGISRISKDSHLHFKSKEDIQKAIEAVGKENFIKYYLGVIE